MNSREKEVLQAQLNAEKEVLKQLEKQYKRALHDIEERVKLFDFDLNRLDNAMSEEGLDDAAKAVLQSQRRSRVYQKQYQEALRGQISGILDKLHGDEYATIQQYLDDSYVSGFVGTMYDIAGQGVPLIMPIDQAAAVRAVQLESKVKKGYYDALGVDIKELKKSIKAEVSRGIATGMNYSDIARNINNVSKTGLSNAKRIARTEAHRIQQASTMDAQRAAKAKGADVVKMWDATMDGKTRTTHRQLDGQIREIDEDFEIGGMKAKAPGYFGRAAEDINCRCVSLTRARWALDEDELAVLKTRAEYFGLDKTKDFEDFTKKYLAAADKIQTGGQIRDWVEWDKRREAEAAREYEVIRNADDVARIAEVSGFSLEDVKVVKDHIFFAEHILYDGVGRFAPSYDMAVAWQRLVAGKPEERDFLLLHHELLENQVEKAYNLTASEAHEMAKAKYNWEQKLFDDLGEEGEPDGLL